MKIKPLKDYNRYKKLQDPSTRDYGMSWIKYEDIEPYLKDKKTVLDIGCKAGLLVNGLRKKGYNSFGVDIGDGCEKKWIENKCDKYCSKLDFIKEDLTGEYDLIVMSHVLEHFYDPNKAMQKVYNLLSKNGLVYCTFPIADSYGAHYFTFESEPEIEPWFEKFGFKAEIKDIDRSKGKPIYKVILNK